MPGHLQQRGYRDLPYNNDRAHDNYQRGRSNTRGRRDGNYTRRNNDRYNDNRSGGSTDRPRNGARHRDSSFHRNGQNNNGRSRDTVQRQRRQPQRRKNSPYQGYYNDNPRGRHQETTTSRNGTRRATTTTTAPDDVTTRTTSGSDPAFTALWTGLARSIQCRHHRQVWQEVPTFVKRNVNNLLRNVNPPGVNDDYRKKMALIGIEFCNKITAATYEHITSILDDNDAKLTHPNIDTLERAWELAISNIGRRLKRLSSTDRLNYASAAASRSKRLNNSTNEPFRQRHTEATTTSKTTGPATRTGPNQPSTSTTHHEDDENNWTLVQSKHRSRRGAVLQTPLPHIISTASTTRTTTPTTNKKRKAESSRNPSPTTDLESHAPTNKLVVTAIEEPAIDMEPIGDDTVDCIADSQPTNFTTRRPPTGDLLIFLDTSMESTGANATTKKSVNPATAPKPPRLHNNYSTTPAGVHVFEGNKDEWEFNQANPSKLIVLADSNLRQASHVPDSLEVFSLPGAKLQHLTKAIKNYVPAQKDAQIAVAIQIGINHRDDESHIIEGRVLELQEALLEHPHIKNVFIVGVPCPTNFTPERRRHVEQLNQEMSEFVTRDFHIPPPTHNNVEIATTDKDGIHHTSETANRILQSIAEAAIGRVFPPPAAC
jgi:hypothetical protein